MYLRKYVLCSESVGHGSSQAVEVLVTKIPRDKANNFRLGARFQYLTCSLYTRNVYKNSGTFLFNAIRTSKRYFIRRVPSPIPLLRNLFVVIYVLICIRFVTSVSRLDALRKLTSVIDVEPKKYTYIDRSDWSYDINYTY